MRPFQRIARHGIIGTIKLLPENLRHLTRAMAPAAIADRRRDREFDRLHGTRTSGKVPLGKTDVTSERAGDATWYEPASPGKFDLMMRCLPSDLGNFTFIDYGSGKGRALLLASRYRFKEIIGIEFSERLHQEAEENLQKYRAPERICYNAKSLLLDARLFTPPPGPSAFFLFNPFGREVMSVVLMRIEDAHRGSASPVYLLYEYPIQESLVLESPFWVKVAGAGLEWAVFARRTIRQDRAADVIRNRR